MEFFLSRLQGKAVVVGEENKLVWRVAKSGSFSINCLYNFLKWKG